MEVDPYLLIRFQGTSSSPVMDGITEVMYICQSPESKRGTSFPDMGDILKLRNCNKLRGNHEKQAISENMI